MGPFRDMSIALLMRMSTLPKAAIAYAFKRAMSASAETSACTKIALPGPLSALISSATALPRCALALVMLAATGYTAWDYDRISQLYLPPEERHERWPGQALQEARRSRLFAGDVAFAELICCSTFERLVWMLACALERPLMFTPSAARSGANEKNASMQEKSTHRNAGAR